MPSLPKATCPNCESPIPPGSPDGLCPPCMFTVGIDTVSDEATAEDFNSGADAQLEGKIVGRYQLLKQVGEGGFGLVFRAEQLEPVRRIVAVKIIKPGMDSKEVVTRFEAERQALALMNHPNIAKIYDAGTSELGRPYFVMEYFEGQPLTAYCDEHGLDIRERLKLFAQICSAVQHAHQKGIIHRDLKPGNILVREKNGREGQSAFPKVIDFGIAKAIDIELTKKTFFTVLGRMVGTPQYMSPEQAELNAVDVDTRSDIYSLGVILYELMTGRAPLQDSDLISLNFDEIRRIIREVDPPKPSARVLGLTAEELGLAARKRGIDTAKFHRILRGDLDWIAMRALEKDRNRRYDTAHGFAIDVRRYLRGLPVNAGPPGAAYRIGKFVRRHRGGTIATLLALLALIGGIGGLMAAYFMILHAREDAEMEHLQSLVASVKNSRSGIPGSRGAALVNLATVGPKLIEIGRDGKQSKELQDDARDELIACLDWIDLHEEPLLKGKGLPEAFVPSVLDPTHERCALHYADGSLEVRDASSGEVLAYRPGAGAGILKDKDVLIRFSPDGALVAAGFKNNEGWLLTIWDWAHDRTVASGIQGVDSAFDFHPGGDGFAVGTRSGTIRYFDRNGEAQGEPLELPAPAHPVAFRYSPSDGHHLAIAREDSIVAVVDVATGMREEEWRVLAPVVSLAWSPDGRSIITGGADGSVTLLERGAQKPIASERRDREKVSQVAWSHDGRLIASGTRDGMIRLWDGRQGTFLCEHTGWAQTLSFSEDDLSLGPVIPESDTYALDVLEVQRERPWVCHRAAGHPGDEISVAAWNINEKDENGEEVIKDGGAILATGAEGGVRLWNREGAELERFPEPRVHPGGLAWSLTHLYVSSDDGISRREISISGERLVIGERMPLASIPGSAQILLIPKSDRLAVACDTRVILLDSGSGAELGQMDAPPSTEFIAASPDGEWLAAGTRHGRLVRIWQMSPTVGFVQDLELDSPANSYATVAFFPLARHPITRDPILPRLMTGDATDYRLWEWNAKAKQWASSSDHPSEMANRQGRMAQMVFSPRGTMVAISYNRKSLQILDPKKLELLTQPGFDEQWPLALSPDGVMLATSGANGHLFIWDLKQVRKRLQDSDLDWKLTAFPDASPIPVIRRQSDADESGE